MADHLKDPPNAQVTSTKQGLSKTPQDMPGWRGHQGESQITSTQCNLSRKESRVAQFGAHPSQGQAQISSTQANLSRKATSPYGNISKTTPQEDL